MVICCCEGILTFIKIIGFIKILELAFRFLWTIRRNLRTTDYLPERYGKDSWAIITGGSDGIGLALSKELARKDFNIVIIARNLQKLSEAAKEIEAVNSNIQVRPIAFDFTSTQEIADYQEYIVDKVKDLDISILINNVGYMQPGDFDKVQIEQHKFMIDVGIMPATILTKLLMDKMLKREKRTAMMFVSSVQAYAPLAGTSTYGGSKVYMDYLSRALSHENRQKMDVLSYQCGLVSTKFIGYDAKRPQTLYQKLFSISPEQAAKRALSDLGYEFQSHGHLKHDIYAMFIRKMLQFAPSFFQKESRSKANNVFLKGQKKQL